MISLASIFDETADRIEAAAGDVYNRLLPLAKKYDAGANFDYGIRYVIRLVAEELGIYLSSWVQDRHGNYTNAVAFLEKNKAAFSVYRPYAKYLTWLANRIATILGPEGQSTIGNNMFEISAWLQANLKNLPSILQGKDVNKLTLPQVIEDAKAQESKKAAESEKIVFTFPDGKTFRRLTSLRSIRDEGNAQHNCCGDSQHMYDKYAEENGWDPKRYRGGIYALRGPKNERLVTVELGNTKKILQALGRNNEAVSEKTYLDVEEAVRNLLAFQFSGDLAEAIKDGSISIGDLVEQDFTEAKMEGASFWGLNFKGSDFSGVDMSDADLGQANFTDCNMSDCDLAGSDVYRAVFANANLDGVMIDNTLQFDKAIGIDKAKNVYPPALEWWKSKQKSASEDTEKTMKEIGL